MAAVIFAVPENPAPGAVPVVPFTRLAIVAAASSIPLLLVAVAPNFSWSRNCAIAYAVTAVVASSIVKFAPLVSDEHVPTTVARSVPVLAAPLAPACPPRATAYNTELLFGHVNVAGTVKAPCASVVSGALSKAVGADPLPVVPAA